MQDLTPFAYSCPEKKGLAPKAIVGASMRKLVHIIYGVTKSEEPFWAEITFAGLEIQEGI